MGPIALFDKSFLQSLSVDEAVWFDRFFMSVVCPIFYIETLADLAKDAKGTRSPEMMVRDAADKFPEMGGYPCDFHIQICVADLLGNHMPMDGRIPRSDSRSVKSGHIYDASPTERAFHRWQKGEFREVERIAAASWRGALQELDLARIARELRAIGIDGKTCNSLEEAKRLANSVVNDTATPNARLALCMYLFQIPTNIQGRIAQRWQRGRSQTLAEFAPYAAYVLTIELFFQFALAGGLIATERPSNRTDIAYLFYLPFSMVFISSDKLHRRCAPLFIRSDQEFVWGVELKPALKSINTHFSSLPEEEKEKGIMRFAGAPPDGNLVEKLWDQFLRPGFRQEADNQSDSKTDTELLRRFNEFRKQPTLPREEASPLDDADMIAIERNIHRRRGSWWQVPKDLPANHDEEDL